MSDLAQKAQKLPTLTAKQAKFVEGVLQGLTKSDAYRLAYGSNMSPDAVSSNAHKLCKNTAIALALETAKREGFERFAATAEQQISRFRLLGLKAEAEGRFDTAISAEDKICKVIGLYHQEDSGREALAQVGAGLVGLVGKELAAQIAKAQGMTLDVVPTEVESEDDTAK